MSSHIYSILPKFSDLLSDPLFYKELMNAECFTSEDSEAVHEDIYDFNELEEVFADHIRMGKRLQKTLYGGNLDDMNDEDLHHPPIALTDLALKLFSKTVPNYGLDLLDMDYVSSFSEATKISPCAMVLAMIYLERLQIKNSDYLESVSPSGLFVVTMLVASKFLFENEDDIVTNQIWAEALSIDVKELNHLEQNFLSAIEWRLYVDSSDFFYYLVGLEKMIAINQSSLRGWLSYSDAYSVLQDAVVRKFLLSFIKRIIKISAVSALGYMMTMLSLYAVGYAVHSRYVRSMHTSLMQCTDMKSNEQVIQQTFIDFSDVSFASDKELSGKKTVLNAISLSTINLYKFENKDLGCQVLRKNNENISCKKYSIWDAPSHTVSEAKHVYDNLLGSISDTKTVMNYTLYMLHWWSPSFKNTCIPVLIQ